MNSGLLDGLSSERLPALRNGRDDFQFYVSWTTGSDTNDGLSWGTAFKTLKRAVNAFPYDTGGTIDMTGEIHWVEPPVTIEDRRIVIRGQGNKTKIQPLFAPAAGVGTIDYYSNTIGVVQPGLRDLTIVGNGVGDVGLRLRGIEFTMVLLVNVGIVGHRTQFSNECPTKVILVSSFFESGYGVNKGIYNAAGIMTGIGVWFEALTTGMDMIGDARINLTDPQFSSVTTKVIRTPNAGYTPRYTEGLATDEYFWRTIGTGRNRWYAAGVSSNDALTTGAPTANRLRVLPFISTRFGKIDQMAINVTAGVAGNARIGIYDNFDIDSMQPINLVYDSGNIDVTSAAVKVVSPNIYLNPNSLYWFGYASSVAPTIRCLPITGCFPILGSTSTLPTTQGIGWDVAHTFGALPAAWPGGASEITAVPIPAIFARYSE